MHKAAPYYKPRGSGGRTRTAPSLRHTLEAREPSPLSCLPSLICKMGHSNILQRLKVKTSSIQAIDPALFPLSGSTYTVLAADRSSRAERKGLHGFTHEGEYEELSDGGLGSQGSRLAARFYNLCLCLL